MVFHRTVIKAKTVNATEVMEGKVKGAIKVPIWDVTKS